MRSDWYANVHLGRFQDTVRFRGVGDSPHLLAWQYHFRFIHHHSRSRFRTVIEHDEWVDLWRLQWSGHESRVSNHGNEQLRFHIGLVHFGVQT